MTIDNPLAPLLASPLLRPSIQTHRRVSRTLDACLLPFYFASRLLEESAAALDGTIKRMNSRRP